VWFLLVSAGPGPRGRFVKEGRGSGAMRDARFCFGFSPGSESDAESFCLSGLNRDKYFQWIQDLEMKGDMLTRGQQTIDRTRSLARVKERQQAVLAQGRERETDRFGAGQAR
jgi:hypothetical protein